MASAKSTVNDEHVSSYLLDLQDRLRLIEATVSTCADALISNDYDKREGDVAQVLHELASRRLDDEIKNLARLVKAWKRDNRAVAAAPPAEAKEG